MSDDYFVNRLKRPGGSATTRSTAPRVLRLKVVESGAIALVGVSRFPVTLQKDEWMTLLEMADQIRVFVSAPDGGEEQAL